MRILFLTQVLPYPPDSGPKVKSWNVLKYLCQHHEVTLVSFVRGDQSEDVKKLKDLCRVYTVPMERGLLLDGLAMVRSLSSRQPWMMVRDERVKMRTLVDRLAAKEHYDIAHADQLNMAQYAARVAGARKILDAHNALWLLYKRLWETMEPGPRKLLLGRDWRLIKRYEGKVCREFDAVLAVSAEDRSALEEAMELPREITVIPIAVDTEETARVQRNPDADHILHIGTMYWPPNIEGVRWFIREVLPLVRSKMPGATLDILGARPPQEIRELGRSDNGIRVTGYVRDPERYLQQAGVMIVPVHAGGGMRVKILNALAQGLPIVSTTIGCEGISVENGEHLLVADTPQDFAEATVRLIQDRGLADRLGLNGSRLIRSKYDYRVVCTSLDDAYNSRPDSH